MSDFDDDEPIDEPEELDARGRGASGRNRPADDDWDDDDWDDDDTGGGGGRRDMTLIVVIAVAVAVIALVVILTRPKSDDSKDKATDTTAQTADTEQPGLCLNWPGAFGGDGHAVAAGEGVYVWSGIVKGQDDGKGSTNGIHIRANRTDAVVVKVTASASVTVKAKGTAQASADSGTEITLTLPAGNGKAGPDLDVSCDVQDLSFEVTAGGVRIPASDIKIGDSGTGTANPTIFKRGDP